MLPEARIDVVLKTAQGRVKDVKVRSSRLVNASRLFAGRRPDEVATLLPTVFSLCGTAQKQACLQAVEAAAGLCVTPPIAAARRAELLAETISEHGLGITRDWPVLVGKLPDLAAAKTLRMALLGRKPDVTAARAAFVSILGGDPDEILADMQAFQSWVASLCSTPAHLFADLVMERLAGFGAGPFIPMPADGPPALDHSLAADEGGFFVARPDGGFETGPLARHHNHPLINCLMHDYGSGILPRLAARLVEVAGALRELALLVQDLGRDATFPSAADGTGLGLVEAARGLLAHRVEMKDGRVTRYQILAPTEWNFHPDGPLTKGLLGAAADSDLPRRAQLLVHALDPCVACNVSVE